MSKALVFLNKKEFIELNSFFPKEHPLFIKIAGLSFLEYYIQIALKLGIKNIEVVSQELSSEDIDHFESGNRWGVELNFRNSNASLESCYNDINGVELIINGLGIIESRIKDKYIDYLKVTNEPLIVKELNFSIIYSKSYIVNFNNMKEFKRFRVKVINSLYKYIYMTKNILCCNSNFTLNAYNNDKDIYLGQNVYIPKTVKIIPPVVIGNNVRLEGFNTIGPNVSIGSNVIIEDYSNVENSIVYDGTFIGKNLELNNKFVYKNRLTSTLNTDLSYYLTDNIFLSEVNSSIYKCLFKSIIRVVVATPYMIISFFPFLLLQLLKKVEIEKESIFLDTIGKEGFNYRVVLKDSTNSRFLNSLYNKFSIEDYRKVLGLFNSTYRLVGTESIIVNKENEKNLALNIFYKPAILEVKIDNDNVDYIVGKMNIFQEIGLFYKKLFKNFFNKR